MSQIQSDHTFPSPRDLHTLSSLPSLRPPLPDRQEAGKGDIHHSVYQLNISGLQAIISLMKNFKKEGIPGLKAENSFLRLKIQIVHRCD